MKLAASLVALILGAGAADAAVCVMYEHSDYRGATYGIAANRSVPWVGQAWNDKVSSARSPRNCKLVLYQHKNFAGNRRVIDGALSHVGVLWNDQVSSAECICQQPLGLFVPAN